MFNNSELQKLRTKLEKVEQELEKVRGCSPLTHGWQTQRYAKASRKWDELAKEKRALMDKIEEAEESAKESRRIILSLFIPFI